MQLSIPRFWLHQKIKEQRLLLELLWGPLSKLKSRLLWGERRHGKIHTSDEVTSRIEP